MRILSYPMTGLTLLALIGISACSRSFPSGEELVTMCQTQAAPGGTYEYDEGTEIPVMRPVGDGTEAGARAFNACIRAKAADAGMIAMTSFAGNTGSSCPDGAAAIYGGATYCIGAQ